MKKIKVDNRKKNDELKETAVIKEIHELKEKGVIKEIDALKETDIFKELKAYRLNKSREENCKPFIIYSDNQLKDLIMKKPRSREEMRKVSGFGEVKVSKYGDDILEIVSKY
ncbi:MAG TPA: HRDC domain-containing protein [Lachnospiraceae bacterium]|nr:HRDC domain-containing protein [Lachnospiraceae bacterium]